MKLVYTCEDCVSFDTEKNFCNLLCIDCSCDNVICPFYFNGSYTALKLDTDV